MPPVSSVALESLAYTAAAPLLAVAPNLSPDGTLNTLVLLSGGAGALGCAVVASSDATRHRQGARGRRLLRLSPLVAGAGVDLVCASTPGWGWGGVLDACLAAGWWATGCLVKPLSRHTRRSMRPAPGTPRLPPAPGTADPVPAFQDTDGADLFTREVRLLWQRAGMPGRTLVVKAIPHPGTRQDLTLLLRASEEGRPITSLSREEIAAAFGVDPWVVTISAVTQKDGRPGGPAWKEVAITPDEYARRRKAPTHAEQWADRVGCERGPIPRSVLISRTRDKERGVTHWLARMPAGTGVPRIDPHALCAALRALHDDGRVFTTVDDRDILVSVWDTSPLSTVFPATRELLTPDADGRWVVGYLGNGQPARNRVYSDRGAAHGLIVAPSGGGKTQLLALSVCADANWGAVVWLATETPDEKTTALGRHIDRQGAGALYVLRVLRAAAALLEIRAEMPWADGQVHDWSPGAVGCPYAPLSLYLDEFLSAARHPIFGLQIMDLAEHISVKGRKYCTGEKVAGQSVYVQDGFTQLLLENLRELSIPVVLKVAARKVAQMFKALGVSSEHIPDPLPRTFTKDSEGRIQRVMNGEPEPPADANTGGVGWIIEGKRPEVLRTLYMDFSRDIAELFPGQVKHLTQHEVNALTARGLWFDWTLPPQPGEFGPDPGGDTDTQDSAQHTAAYGTGHRRPGMPRPGDTVTSPAQALAALKRLTSET
ncbi:chromosome segregation protein ParM [Streptomyces sp. MNP-20]|uniref:chromosome segregation protein ParM n=1 Tax=Streptomyces sp. MNP-20 TaxID=2721165 RepID=UPI0015553B10|nr:chromosome segregation protein ParM [Streptomyces sp. MNP-20]